jgi:transposase
MSETRRRFDDEFKKNAVRLSYESNKPVAEVALDMDISGTILYRLQQKYTAQEDKTWYATLEEENRDLRRQLAESKMGHDMLKNTECSFALSIFADCLNFKDVPFPIFNCCSYR